jgi:hypothetical protein
MSSVHDNATIWNNYLGLKPEMRFVNPGLLGSFQHSNGKFIRNNTDNRDEIGQARPVTIYRLVAKNTIEEKIIKLHHTKRDMADSLLEGTDQAFKTFSQRFVKPD